MAQSAESISPVNTAHSPALAVETEDAALLESLLGASQTTSAPVTPVRPAVRFATAAAPVPRTISPAPTPMLGGEQRMELIHSCQGIVRSLAWKIHRKLPQNIDLDDLIAYGQVGLAQAARDFDPTLGGKFITYAYWRVRGAILDGLSQMSWFKRQDFHASKYEVQPPSEPIAADATEDGAPPSEQRHGQQTGQQTRQQTGQQTRQQTRRTPGQPSEAVGNPPQRPTISSIGAESPTEADFTGAGSVADVSTRPPPTQSMMREMMEHVRKSIELLPPESATLIRLAYFEGVTLHEAGRRLGISRGWTSRLHARALEKLGRELRSHWSGE